MDNSITMTQAVLPSAGKADSSARPPAAVPAPSAPPAPPPAAEAAPDQVEQVDLEDLLERVGEQLNEFSRQSGRQLEFQVNNDSNRVVILVKSTATGEVVRAIPPEEAQRLAEALEAGQPALVDERA